MEARRSPGGPGVGTQAVRRDGLCAVASLKRKGSVRTKDNCANGS